MTQAGGAAAFLPFLKKKPVPAATPAEDKEDEDPLALPIPPAPKASKLSNTSASTKFVSKLNGKAGSGHAAGSRPTPPPKGTSIAGTRKLPANGASSGTTRKPGAAGTVGKPAAAAGAAKPVLSAAEAKAEAERRRLRQLQRLAKMGALAKDAAPEVVARIEAAKQQVAAIERQQQLEAKHKAEQEQHRRQLELHRQQQEQERRRLLAEKQRLQAAKLGKAGAPGSSSLGAKPAAGSSAAAAAGPGRGVPDRSKTPPLPSAATGRGAGVTSSASATARQQGQQQQGKDPYAGLNPKQRAFLLARQRERERRMGGRGGGGADSRPGRSRPRYGSDDEQDMYDDVYDDLDDFIDDDMGDDWRKELRGVTGYDPSRYSDSLFDDRRMEASAAEIQAEERRSARIAKTEDEKEAEAEARRMAAKEAKKKSKKRGAAALFDD